MKRISKSIAHCKASTVSDLARSKEYDRKDDSLTQAVDERRELQTESRAARSKASQADDLKDRLEQAMHKQQRLQTEEATLTERQSTVSPT